MILFEKLELPVIKKTKTGYSTDVSVLEELSAEHELPEVILLYRQLGKLKSTYVGALQEEIFGKTVRVQLHSTSRLQLRGLSSSNPNLQNIPIRTEMGREIRKSFIAEENNKILSADYSQVELRVLAHMSEDKFVNRCFYKWRGYSYRTEIEIFGTTAERLDAQARRMAKAVNFGIVYGLSAFGFPAFKKFFPERGKEIYR
ncbi:MAG: hypothetical protein Ct9H300mP23_03340 [Nitrospinota bacterium]|nr:MAG: hypothetical protein Ct9H300mP23_03340 [Nitrospinota bacterium]